MENTQNNSIWLEFRPMEGIASQDDCRMMEDDNTKVRYFNGYAYAAFTGIQSAIDFVSRILKCCKLSKKYEVRMFSHAQFRLVDLSMSNSGKGFPVEFTDKQNEKIIIIG